MQWMISQDVDAQDVGVRSYNNFNFTILLYLIPAIAYPEDVAFIHGLYEDWDVDDYSLAINAWYGILYEKYMEEEIFANTDEFPISATCRPAQDLAGDAYAKQYANAFGAVGTILNPDGSEFCRSQGSWYVTPLDLIRFTRTYAFTNNFIGPTTRASLFDPDAADDRLLYNRLVTNIDFAIDQSEFPAHGGEQDNYRAALVALPYGYFGVGMANSPEFGSGALAQQILDAFQSAIEDTPPVISRSVSGVLGKNSWYVSDITVTWTVVDPDSEIVSSSGCDETVISSDTDFLGQTLTCTASSLGGTTSESVTLRRDATAPSVDVTGVQDGDSFAAVDPPDIGCTASDPEPGSGIVNDSPAPEISDDGAGNFSASCQAEDRAGNQDTATVQYRLVSLEVIAGTVAQSSLNDGNKNSLLVMLEQAQKLLDQGLVSQAVHVMVAFRNHVQALLQAGALPPEEGQLMLEDIDVLIAHYG
jgi:hypothetical protein